MENRTNKRMQWVIRLGCILGLMTALCGCSSTEVVKIAKYAAKEALKTTAPQKDRSEGESSSAKDADGKGSDSATQSLDNLKDHAAYNGEPYVELNDNVPNFTTREKNNTKAFENYHRLDALGRCGTAYANICKELMPTEKRGAIGMVKPSGWNTVKYDVVDGKYLYNRCHLIGFQLAGENANKKNLITGTRYLNVDGMLPFEDEVADYVKNTDHHVLYRVTPVFKGDNLVAEGVEMEAYSVEDKGKGICFHVFVYNVQPGVEINYADGKSKLAEGQQTAKNAGNKPEVCPTADDYAVQSYVLNNGSKKFHKPDCSGAEKISAKNKENFKGRRAELISKGYSPCGICKP